MLYPLSLSEALIALALFVGLVLFLKAVGPTEEELEDDSTY